MQVKCRREAEGILSILMLVPMSEMDSRTRSTVIARQFKAAHALVSAAAVPFWALAHDLRHHGAYLRRSAS